MIKANFDEESADRAKKQVQLVMDKVLNNKKMLNEVGELIVTDIVRQTRTGKRADGSRFQRLSKKWKQTREKIAEVENTHPTYQQARTNLSLTGQMLDSFTSFIVGKGQLMLKFVGIHRPYSIKTRKGIGTVGKNTPNEVIAQGLNERFGFLGVRPQVIDRAKTIIVGYIRRSRRTIEKITK